MLCDNTLLHCEHVAVNYRGGVRALADLAFDIPPGQFVSIVGPSGCGKSTVLRLAAGLIEPSAGRMTLAGQTPRAARRRGTRLALVFQDATLLPWRSIGANVTLPLELVRQPRAARQAAAARVLDMVGLADFARRFPNQLSGGMRMRASLARALVVEPEVLLLDEPFAALDDITRHALNEELLRLWGERRWTAVFVTHNIAEAVFLSQRILVLGPRPGRVVADVEVPFDYPRSTELRSRGEFARLCGVVNQRLREACS